MEKIGLPEIEFHPVRYRILAEFYPAYGRRFGGIVVDEVGQLDGPPKFAVRLHDNFDLSKSEGWHYAPMPSSRTDEYLQEHRWDDLESARAAATEAARIMLADAASLPKETNVT